jgi:carbon-monoxide dehydrogenase small subunit
VREAVCCSGPVSDLVQVQVTVNGRAHARQVEPRLLLSDFLRLDLGLTGTHVGCEHGVCGACTVLVDEEPVRACLMFAVQADGARITTVESAGVQGTGVQNTGIQNTLDLLRVAFRDAHALQCGFCTPGILMSMAAFLRDCPDPNEQDIREALSGHLCRCTGYANIVRAVRLAHDALAR